MKSLVAHLQRIWQEVDQRLGIVHQTLQQSGGEGLAASVRGGHVCSEEAATNGDVTERSCTGASPGGWRTWLRYREFVFSVASWSLAAAATVGWACPTCDTLLMQSR